MTREIRYQAVKNEPKAFESLTKECTGNSLAMLLRSGDPSVRHRMDIEITKFSMSDYEESRAFWASIPEVGIDDADSISSMESFLKRNPGLSFVAKHGKDLIGAVLCGHDGRRGYLHHLAVSPGYRGRGIGKRLVYECLSALSRHGISRCNIFIYSHNEKGKEFWEKTGWTTYDGLEIMYRSVEQIV